MFYGPLGGHVNHVAEIISNALGKNVELIAVENASPEKLLAFDHLILGISTIGRANWDSSHSNSGWEAFLTRIKDIDLTGKHVAIYGLGDAVNYPDHFVDAIGELHDRIKAMGATMDGYCDNKGYAFNESAALRNNSFVGLPLDEDNEAELTSARVNAWIESLKALKY